MEHSRIMDGIEECGRSGDAELVTAAEECVASLLDAIEKLCVDSNEHVSAEVAAVMLKQWPKLQDADYTGPLTYQTMARLPSPYRYYYLMYLTILILVVKPKPIRPTVWIFFY